MSSDAEILAAVPEALRDQVTADLANVRAINVAFDAIFGRSYRDDTETCQRCGRKTAPRCKCDTPDQPEERPNTGWTLV